MPAEPDRVSVGSPGGAGGNEIEAVVWALKANESGSLAERATAVIAALDAVRRSPQGVPFQPTTTDVHSSPPVRSLKGEDPDGGFDSAAGETHSWPQGEEHEGPPPGKFVSIAANKAMAAPVSDTEPDTAKLLGKITDKAKYLAEGAWDARGTRLVGEQIHKWASEALAGFSVDAGSAEER